MAVNNGGLVSAQFTGRNGAGSISVPGLQVGDIVLAFKEGSGTATSFENYVSVADEFQQTGGGNFSASTLHVVFFRGTFS